MGICIVSPGDIHRQMEYALGNGDAVLTEAGRTRNNVLNSRFFTTDIDGILANYDEYAQPIADAGPRPPQALLEVQQPVLPELMVG